MTKSWAAFLLKLAVAAALLLWLVKTDRINIDSLGAAIADPLFFVGLAFLALSLLLQIVRWRWLLIIQGLRVSPLNVARWTLIGEFFALALPGGAGTELARGYFVLRASPGAKTAALSTVLVDRALGLLALLILGAVAGLNVMASGQESGRLIEWLSAVAIFGGTAGLIGLVALRWPAFQAALAWITPKRFSKQVQTVIEAYGGQLRTLSGCLLLSILSQLPLMACFMVAAEMLQIQLSWEMVFLTVPFVIVANTLPFTPAGIGVGEAATALIFADFGILEGATLMLTVRLWLLTIQLVGGATYVLRPRQAGEQGAAEDAPSGQGKGWSR